MDPGLINTWLIAAVLLAISLGALFKGMTGIGLPIFAVPAIAMITSVEEAVILMIIPGLAANMWLVARHRRFFSLLREHYRFLLAGFIGGILGTVFLARVDDRWLKLLLAGWLALYLIQYVLGDLFRQLFRSRGKAAIVFGLTAGTLQGATGMSAHVVAPYFHDRNISPEGYALLVTSAFLIFSVAQFSTSVATGLFTPERLLVSAIALLPTLFFTRVGISMGGMISATTFNRILLATFVAMEMKLLADVL